MGRATNKVMRRRWAAGRRPLRERLATREGRDGWFRSIAKQADWRPESIGIGDKAGILATATGTDHRIGDTITGLNATATMIGIGDKVDKARRLTNVARRPNRIGTAT